MGTVNPRQGKMVERRKDAGLKHMRVWIRPDQLETLKEKFGAANGKGVDWPAVFDAAAGHKPLTDADLERVARIAKILEAAEKLADDPLADLM